MSRAVRILSDKDFKSAQALEVSLFDDQRGAYGYLENKQREITVEEIKSLELEPVDLPEKATVAIGTQISNNVPRRQWASKVSRVKLGQPVLIRDLEQADVPNKEEVLKVAREVFLELKLAAPPGGAVKNHPWRYRELFRFLVGGTAYESIPVSKDFTVIGITNVSPHAATLENPGWSRPFNTVWRRLVRRARSQKFDVRFSYIRGGSVPFKRTAYFERQGFQLNDITPYGVLLRRSDYGRQAFIRYATPVIWIGPFGSMRGKTGIFPTPRHRRNRLKPAGQRPKVSKTGA
jgi:hypothetical protein